jgi:hypothetical protein
MNISEKYHARNTKPLIIAMIVMMGLLKNFIDLFYAIGTKKESLRTFPKALYFLMFLYFNPI